jgi:hypothetical protein
LIKTQEQTCSQYKDKTGVSDKGDGTFIHIYMRPLTNIAEIVPRKTNVRNLSTDQPAN